MTPPVSFAVRVRGDAGELDVIYPITRRRHETVPGAIRRALRAASGDDAAVVAPGFATFLISDTWQPAYRLTFRRAGKPDFAADVDVPADFSTLWL